MRTFLWICLAFALTRVAAQQVSLSNSPYIETFDGIFGGFPNGWSGRTAATATALGTTQSLTTTASNWVNQTGAFKNSASADGLTSASTSGEQSSSSDRVLSLRQTGTFANSQVAFVLKIANTTGFENLAVAFKLQSLDVASPRNTSWSVDFGIGETPTSFTTVATTPAALSTGNSSFTNQLVTATLPSSLNDLGQPIYIRIISLNATTGSGNRATTGIDDFTLTFDELIGTNPKLLTSATSLSSFTTSQGTPSTEKSFTVRGANLTEGITITAPTNYEVSATSGSNFSSSIVLPLTNGSVANTSIYVRITGATAGNFSGDIRINSLNAAQKLVSVSGVVNPPLSASTPIATVRGLANGTTVTVAGRATVGSQFGGLQIFIQDATGGISIYQGTGNMVQDNGIAIGDSIQVQGTLATFNELKQITVTQLNKVNVAPVIPEPKVIQATEILANEGQLVRINDVNTPTATYAAQTNYSFLPVQVRITQQTNGAGFVNPLVGTSITLGMGYAIGIAGRFNTSAQLLPRLVTDLVRTGEPTPGSTDGDFENPNTLDVACWNIEWFGSTTNGPSNETLQQSNAKTIIETINADIYNLNEISNLQAFNDLAATLSGYTGVCSTELSNDNNDPTAQRVCFLYKTNLFSNVTVRPLLKTIKDNPTVLIPNYPDPTKSRFWASGRLPFALKADVTIPGSPTTNIMFVGIHARANTSTDPAESFSRYSMRKYDVEVLKDSLDAQFPDQKIIMLGDFNDDLDLTVAGNVPNNITSYVAYNSDPTRYNMNTRVLSDAGLKSTVGFSDMIDHLISSNELTTQYVAGSARVSNVEQYITSYGTTTSDHYPVMARFNLQSSTPCLTTLTLVSPTDDISSGRIVYLATNANGGKIEASNVISGTANVSIRSRVIELKPGFVANNGVVFSAETGGCVN